MSSYLAAFSLKDHPFSKEIADTDLWLPSSKQAAVDGLLDALSERASVVLTGEPGVGKTCVLRALRHRIPSAGFRLTYCHNATLGRRDFYRQLCVALGLQPSATAAGVFYAVSTLVEDLAKERVHPVFLLDEAHLLHQDTLDHLELQDRLTLRRNRSLYSRLHHRITVDALMPDDTGEYLRTRLKRAGCDRELFATDAVALLHEATSGSMREIDRIASASLREAARKKRRLVERDLVARAIEASTRDAA